MKMLKTFKDLEFRDRIDYLHIPGFGVYARQDYDNGYAVSVLKGKGTYGYEQGLYELAVFRDGNLCYDTPITSDVIGYLTPKKVSYYMKKIQLLPSAK